MRRLSLILGRVFGYLIAVGFVDLTLLSGHLQIAEWDAAEDGSLSLSRTIEQKNLAVLAGRNLLRDLLKDKSTAGASLTHIEFGTSATAVTANDTTLGTAIGSGRFVFTSTTTASGQLVYKYFLASGSLNGNTIREAGLFNASSGGTMFARTVLSTAIVKTSAKAYTFTWTLNFNAA